VHRLADLAHAEVVVALAGLAVVIAFKLLTGDINLHGLLQDKIGRGLSPERVQLLAVSLAVIVLMLTNLDEMRKTREIAMPSALAVYAFGSSNVVYLVGKYLRKPK
jgi:hypothetical protein